MTHAIGWMLLWAAAFAPPLFSIIGIMQHGWSPLAIVPGLVPTVYLLWWAREL